MKERQRFWIPENVPDQVIIEQNIKIKGRFTIDLIHAKTGNVKQHLEFDNLITNATLNALGSGSMINGFYNYLEVGTGTTTPTPTDAFLESPLSPRTNSNGGESNVDSNNNSPPYVKRKIVRVFNESQVNGELTELGFYTAQNFGTLINRALMLDSAGNPTIVYKTPSDILKVSFEYRIYPPTDDVSGIVTLDGNEIQYTLRPQGYLLANNWGRALTYLGDSDASAAAYNVSLMTPIGTANSPSSPTLPVKITTDPYVNNSFYRDVTFEWSTGFVPVGGLGLVTFCPWFTDDLPGRFAYQVGFTPKIVKSDEQTFRIKIRTHYGRN